MQWFGERGRGRPYKSGNARTVDKNSFPVYNAAFSTTVDLKFSCDNFVCVCVFYHPKLSPAFLSFLKSFDSTNSIICYSFYFSNLFCPFTTFERCLSHISSCTVVRSLAFDLCPSYYYHIDQPLTVCVLPLLFLLHFSRLTF